MLKISGKNRGCLIVLNIPQLREKINKTCANRPVSCVNGEVRTEFGSAKETAYHCTERARTPTESFSAPFCSKSFLKIHFIGLLFCYTPVRTKRHRREQEWKTLNCGMWAVMWRSIRGRARSCSRRTPCGRRWKSWMPLDAFPEIPGSTGRELENTNVKWM